ncbi:alpha/beta hydrolase [Vibrio japonicus]|uniref:Alpha/beta hydrolase n=1 Tax=Vibrio japonicus TaxID=1824638 RepID=A0ABY5LQG7_9VIBR|nr:alpha/beta hydrolase [Vibrio japonicus]UUM31985.1 alpha/beta hydrolase [Vibrio japonicus]
MGFMSYQGRAICYHSHGEEGKPLLILAHPLGMNQTVWEGVLPYLIPSFKVVTWDLPGHGKSEALAEDATEIMPDDLAGEVLALADQVGEERFHFVGTSIGGVIGQQLLINHSDRLISAVLTNTGAVIGTPENWQTRSTDVLDKGLGLMAEQIVPRWFGQLACRQQPGLIDAWKHKLAECDNRSYALLCEMLGQTDFRQKPLNKEVQLVLVGGSDDVATPPQSLQQLADLSNADAPIILDGIGHVPSVEDPVLFSKILLTNMY